jgi:hypothetical protein
MSGPQDPAVLAVFEAYAPDVRAALLDLRQSILETAAAMPGVGPLTETLRWGQPSYLTQASKSGTTIRIDAVKARPGAYALYVNCKTSLLESYRHLYPDAFGFEGNRALRLDAGRPPPQDALRHCIALALSYHRSKTAAA